MPGNFMDHQHEPENQNQDSVWDYFVEKIKFWTHDPVEKEKIETPGTTTSKPAFPWLSLVSLILALMAQLTFEPSPGRTHWPGIILYLAAGGCLLASTDSPLTKISSFTSFSVRYSINW